MPSLALPPAEEPPAGGGSPTAAARAAALATVAPAPEGPPEAGAGVVAGEDRPHSVWVGGVPWSTPAEEAEGVLRGALAAAGISEETALVQVALFGPHRQKTRRERKFIHRGFAIVSCDDQTTVEAVCGCLDKTYLFEGWRGSLRCSLKVLVASELRGGEAPEPPPPPPPEPPGPLWEAFESEMPAVAADPEVTPKLLKEIWRMAELQGEGFPTRESCLEPGTKWADLPPQQQARLWVYIRGVLPKCPELTAICVHVHDNTPQNVRVKEIIESFEAFKLCESFIDTNMRMGKDIATVWEMACGHGMAGLILAYRYPWIPVVCVDLFQRGVFEAFRAAFVAKGSTKYTEGKAPLDNVRFVEGELEGVAGEIKEDHVVVAVHACTGASVAVLGAAQAAGAAWAVLPCCMRVEDYLPGIQLSRVPDGVRYGLLCGALAVKYGAQMVRCLDSRITNRTVFMAGGCPPALEGGQKLQFHLRPEGREPQKVRRDRNIPTAKWRTTY